MGVKLIVEVMRNAPETLSAKELYAATVFAEDANDITRVIWSGIENPEFLYKLRVKRARLYELIDSLVSKGVLELASAGHRHGRAKYRFAHFARHPQAQCPEGPDDQCPEEPDTETQCPEDVDTEGGFSVRETQTLNHDQCPEDPDLSVRETRTPTPLLPSLDPPPPSPTPSTSRTPDSPTEGGGGDLEPDDAEEPNPAAATLIAGLPYVRQPTRNEHAELTQLAADALGSGLTATELKTELERDLASARDRIHIWRDRLQPGNLPMPAAFGSTAQPSGAGGSRPCAPGECDQCPEHQPCRRGWLDDDNVCPCWTVRRDLTVHHSLIEDPAPKQATPMPGGVRAALLAANEARRVPTKPTRAPAPQHTDPLADRPVAELRQPP